MQRRALAESTLTRPHGYITRIAATNWTPPTRRDPGPESLISANTAARGDTAVQTLNRSIHNAEVTWNSPLLTLFDLSALMPALISIIGNTMKGFVRWHCSIKFWRAPWLRPTYILPLRHVGDMSVDCIAGNDVRKICNEISHVQFVNSTAFFLYLQSNAITLIIVWTNYEDEKLRICWYPEACSNIAATLKYIACSNVTATFMLFWYYF